MKGEMTHRHILGDSLKPFSVLEEWHWTSNWGKGPLPTCGPRFCWENTKYTKLCQSEKKLKWHLRVACAIKAMVPIDVQAKSHQTDLK